MRPALLMRGVYEPYLDRIEAGGFRPDGHVCTDSHKRAWCNNSGKKVALLCSTGPGGTLAAESP